MVAFTNQLCLFCSLDNAFREGLYSGMSMDERDISLAKCVSVAHQLFVDAGFADHPLANPQFIINGGNWKQACGLTGDKFKDDCNDDGGDDEQDEQDQDNSCCN